MHEKAAKTKIASITAVLKRPKRATPNTAKSNGHAAVAGSAGATFWEAVAVRRGTVLRNTVIPNAVDEMMVAVS